MNKPALFFGTILLVIGSIANAAPTYCIQFSNYCDGMTFTRLDGAREVEGYWQNTDCAGATAAVRGDINGRVVTIGCGVSTEGCPNGWGWTFKFNIPARTFDMYTDMDGPGGGSPIVWLLDEPFRLTTIDTGRCPFAAPNANALPTWASH